MIGQNHLTARLFNTKMLSLSCNLLNTVRRVINRVVVRVQNCCECVSVVCPCDHVADWELYPPLPSIMRDDSTVYHGPGKTSKFEVWFLLYVYHFCTILMSKPCKVGTVCTGLSRLNSGRWQGRRPGMG